MIVALQNIPKTQEQWNIFSFNHLLSHTAIRQALSQRAGVASVTVTAGGSGYTSVPNVEVVGGGGSGFAGTVTITSGVLTSITVTSPGSGYSTPPALVFSGGGGSGAAATAVLGSGIQLTEYQLDPIDFNDIGDWLQRNSQAHIEIDSVIGGGKTGSGTDLEDVDIKDNNQFQAWVWLHFLRHQSEENALGISS